MSKGRRAHSETPFSPASYTAQQTSPTALSKQSRVQGNGWIGWITLLFTSKACDWYIDKQERAYKKIWRQWKRSRHPRHRHIRTKPRKV
ncbi:hypothetical protein CBOM_07959 [Ceraceosorus bombacis]|uniref:Uncharacterized protein n=1 Tax=Ceraceosorus bombacis TaxID=401625 RepID=A0A0P1BRY2_9BASI|nr:hypothetical protein CBOM_07959 [Ceraceosorus bombacis]